ncbi:MarR family winged helix-turn-helix transcriptional regulator [Paenibacillus sp. URB8-2]|uniref:MarR family winged helix-turn-helix transcriptional regulator n=1 Tax=Paenibacillus sp. URB8-2 TaxID=2741301 RepID=UPI0015BF731C|nr:MarR family transcriptional regulator [Paenibacillus sp. URB8-2]BCG57960.1 hypothetical protein PUR_13850 [Paenibacillus sp. URB8-2]
MNGNLGYLIHKVSVMSKSRLTQRLKAYGLTAQQWSVIKDISATGAGATPAMIAKRLHADRPTITGILNRLADKGFVYTRDNPKDRRSQFILLTDQSMELIAKLEDVSNKVMKEALRGVPDSEIRTTIGVLRQMMDNLGKEELE